MKVFHIFILSFIIGTVNPSNCAHVSSLVSDRETDLDPELAISLDTYPTTHSYLADLPPSTSWDFTTPSLDHNSPPTLIKDVCDNFLKSNADNPPIDHHIEVMKHHVDETEWLVPQLDDTLKLMTEEEVEIEIERRSNGLLKNTNPKIIFYLYARLDQLTPEVITINDTAFLSRSNFNPKIPTRFIIHGWRNNYQSSVNSKIRKALHTKGKYNVICVDWSDKADNIIYPLAAMNVASVGKIVAEMIDFLHNKGKLSLTDLTLIGYSLGAHVAGIAGKHVTVGKIHTIIGLDPAKPLFKYKEISERLHESDAVYVESIHTCGDLLGFLQPIGKVAFYPNGGKSQPGCGIDLIGSCAHSRSFVYYAESILRKGFTSIVCPDYQKAVQKSCEPNNELGVLLGNKENEHLTSGIYYTPINNKVPFGR